MKNENVFENLKKKINFVVGICQENSRLIENSSYCNRTDNKDKTSESLQVLEYMK